MCLLWIEQVELQVLVMMDLLWVYMLVGFLVVPRMRGYLSREETAMVNTRQHAV